MTLEATARAAMPAVDYAAVRVVDERTEQLALRNGLLQPAQLREDRGAMVTVVHQGGLGYAATSDLGAAGLAAAFARACEWAERTAQVSAIDHGQVRLPQQRGHYKTPVQQPWSALSIGQRIALLRSLDQAVGPDPLLVDRGLSLTWSRTEQLLWTSGGGAVEQTIERLGPDARFVAHRDGVTQTRSTSARGGSQQGGLEVLQRLGFAAQVVRLADEARALLDAPECPSGTMDLVLAPDQMMLQIHESIGHPLELDRILGDERNYAGTSFVQPEMFGTYDYGSALLDVTFDPTVPSEFASFGFDDDGAPATREYLIKGGRLLRGLGGTTSQARSGLAGVSCARASSWNRPPIDRMANLNVEPGGLALAALLAQVERGVWMETNCSWSIDDSRNKFQFGCELGREIKDGELGGLVRNPNYRGVSATFWRNLAGVGDAGTREVLGTPYCGKGEPNQVIRVGHASPVCHFRDVDIFGGVGA